MVLADGTRLSEEATAVLGTAGDPMTRVQVVSKARDLMTPVLGASTAAKLIERILDFENIKNIRELRPLLQRS